MKTPEALWKAVRQRVAVVLRDEKQRVNLLVLLGLAGMVLLCLSEWIPGAGSGQVLEPEVGISTASAREEDYARALEEKLSDTLRCIDGVGRCKVMVTLSTSEQTVYAQDVEQNGEETRKEHVVLGQDALVEGVLAPDIQGVAVVCDGGNRTAVQYAVTQSVSALTGVGANRITVNQMASE